MKGQYDEKYLRKCHKRLRELGAPLENWSCIEVEDGETADFICELCGCDRKSQKCATKKHILTKIHIFGGLILSGLPMPIH